MSRYINQLAGGGIQENEACYGRQCICPKACFSLCGAVYVQGHTFV